MATLKKTVNETYYWSINRMCELDARGNFKDVMDGDSIRQEFDEWIMAENKNLMRISSQWHISEKTASMIYNLY